MFNFAAGTPSVHAIQEDSRESARTEKSIKEAQSEVENLRQVVSELADQMREWITTSQQPKQPPKRSKSRGRVMTAKQRAAEDRSLSPASKIKKQSAQFLSRIDEL